MTFVDGNFKTIADRAYNGVFLMSINGGMKTTARESYDDREYADGAGAVEDFIVIEADTKVDRCHFLYLIEYTLCKSLVLSYNQILVIFGCNSLG
jgi:hypothetical protein